MRGSLLLKALELLEEGACSAADFIDAFLSSSKSDYRALRRYMPRGHRSRIGVLRETLLEKQRLYELIYRLERDGLVHATGKKRAKRLRISEHGERKKEGLKQRLSRNLPEVRYVTEPAATITICTFDVPEREKHKREWLRRALAYMEFRMLQKSVWVKRGKLPREFIEDLGRLALFPAVEIFTISNTGTIRHIA